MSDDLRYPIGKFSFEPPVTEAKRAEWIGQIAETPVKLREAVAGLSDAQLDTPYRPEGWTVRQVVHHLPDSHINSYVRFKWALTEDAPDIKVYDQDAWAMLPDGASGPIVISLNLLDAVHARWVALLRAMTPEDYAKRFRHPDLGEVPLDAALGGYAWHGRHHVAHITALRERQDW